MKKLLSVLFFMLGICGQLYSRSRSNMDNPKLFDPSAVSKDLRIKALEGEIAHVSKSIRSLEQALSEKHDYVTVIKLRLFLKHDYLHGLEQLLTREQGQTRVERRSKKTRAVNLR